jgi:hypothetical protein
MDYTIAEGISGQTFIQSMPLQQYCQVLGTDFEIQW